MSGRVLHRWEERRRTIGVGRSIRAGGSWIATALMDPGTEGHLRRKVKTVLDQRKTAEITPVNQRRTTIEAIKEAEAGTETITVETERGPEVTTAIENEKGARPEPASTAPETMTDTTTGGETITIRRPRSQARPSSWRNSTNPNLRHKSKRKKKKKPNKSA